MISFPNTGYSVKPIPSSFYSILSNLLREFLLTTKLYSDYFSTTMSDAEIYKLIYSDLSFSSRASRTVPPNLVSNHKSSIIQQLRPVIGTQFDIYRNDLYFRFVSPDQPHTQSVVHRDLWFHSITSHWTFLPESSNIKLWLPLFYSQSDYGIGVIPSSHHDNPYDFDYINTPTGPQFVPHHDYCTNNLTPVNVPIGYGLFFPPTLLHGGLDITLFSPRVSCELTLLV